jgi:glycopeptide antibiotics resistance protein
MPMISKNESHNRLRRTYFVAVVITILLGLASRKFGYLLFSFLAENAGDVLWAMMVYFGFRFLFLKKSMLTASFLSFLFSFGIEFSQLYQEDWINQIRGTLLGALILGKGYLTVDLIRYTTGIVIAFSMDCLIIKEKHKNK